MNVIATWNEKGGTGKTTTTVNLAAALAERGSRTLLVDLDPSHNMSKALDLFPDAFKTHVHRLFPSPDPQLDVQPLEIQQAIHEVPGRKNLFIVPGHRDLEPYTGLRSHPKYQDSWAFIVSEILAPIDQAFEFVILDCPTGLGFFPMNAIAAADLLLVPVQTTQSAIDSLPEVAHVVSDLIPVEHQPAVLILPCLFDRRNSHDRDALKAITASYSDVRTEAVIPRATAVAESVSARKPFIHYASDHEVAPVFRALAEEVRKVCQQLQSPV